jgi:hypothetical protein
MNAISQQALARTTKLCSALRPRARARRRGPTHGCSSAPAVISFAERFANMIPLRAALEKLNNSRWHRVKLDGLSEVLAKIEESRAH